MSQDLLRSRPIFRCQIRTDYETNSYRLRTRCLRLRRPSLVFAHLRGLHERRRPTQPARTAAMHSTTEETLLRLRSGVLGCSCGGVSEVSCWCRGCNPYPTHMIVCPECGNKRCPRATNHQHACTGSNEPGQAGSVYEKQFLPAAFGIPPNLRQRDMERKPLTVIIDGDVVDAVKLAAERDGRKIWHWVQEALRKSLYEIKKPPTVSAASSEE